MCDAGALQICAALVYIILSSLTTSWCVVQITEMLPSIAEDDYSIEPSLTQLAAMARDDPDSLGAVSGFKVSRQGIGSVRWLEPTDVRSLNVNSVVRLTKGAVEVRTMPDQSCTCPSLAATKACTLS